MKTITTGSIVTRATRVLVASASVLCAAVAVVGAADGESNAHAGRNELAAAPAGLIEGDAWSVLRIEDPASLPVLEPGWDGRTFWDLRPPRDAGRRVRWVVLSPIDAGRVEAARKVGANLALCADADDGWRGCGLFDAAGRHAAGPRMLWSDLPGQAPGPRKVTGGLEPDRFLTAGTAYEERVEVDGGPTWNVASRAIAEGVVLLPSGPAEAVLLRELTDAAGGSRLRYRFIDRVGMTVALLEGVAPAAAEPFRPKSAELMLSPAPRVDDGIEIAFETLRDRLTPGNVGFLQYSLGPNATLSTVNGDWTGIGDVIAIDQTGVAYQPDPDDPSSTQTLPEVWNFTGLNTSVLNFRTFNTTRDDLPGNPCGENCALRDVGANPPDGTWQKYLKIDTYNDLGAFATRAIFELNDNDTGADPSFDLVFVSQDELNTSDWTQICFAQSAGGADRFLRFFQFTGLDPSSAVLGVGDTWTSGNWSECDNANGLRLTVASQCGAQCWPGCSVPDPRARGRLPGNAGFRSTIIEDGFILLPTGNYVPAILLRQDTDVEAGLDFIGVCVLGTTPNRSFDYFWLQDRYGLLASISSVTSETIAAADWTAEGNVTDLVDITWGPYPPFQTDADACLSGTRVNWSLPADGSNLNAAPNVSDYGYVVSWGSQADPEVLADPAGNPNHTPLPGEAGYLAAPSGSEPTSMVIAGWPGASINVTVTTALRYTDPDAIDVRTYRSAAFYKVVEDPARLDSGMFQVGNGVVPFVAKAGNDLQLSWPAVAGVGGYELRVWDLATKHPVACPAGLDCSPATPSATHAGAAVDLAAYGYRAFAVDACGEASTN